MTDLAANALTTLATALDELGLTADDGAQDDRIKRYINAASSLFERWSNRRWYRAAGHVEYVGARGGDRLLLVDHLPVTSVTSVVYDDGVQTETVDADFYEIEGDGGAGILRRVRGRWADTRMHVINITSHPGSESPREVYAVTYTGGYVTPEQAADDVSLTRTLPSYIEDAVLQYVSMRNAQRGADASVKRLEMLDGMIEYQGERVPRAFYDAAIGGARVVFG